MDNLGDDFRKNFLEKGEARAYRNAPMWKRAVALIVDIIALNLIVFSPFGDVFNKYFSSIELGALESTALPSHIYASIFFLSVLTLLYFALMQYASQQTLGMMLTKIYVQPKSGFWKSLVRNLFVLPFFPFNLLWIIEPLYLFFKGQRILEKLTSTNTVESHG